jgi:formylglycine-generating enzyme required for sulfatase activity
MKNKLWNLNRDRRSKVPLLIIAILTAFTLSTTPCFAQSGGGGTITSSTGIVMVSIPAGTFTMGSPANEPDRGDDETQHSVTLSAFSMSKYQVTQEQYQAVMGSNPSFFSSNFFSSNPQAGETQGKRPVEMVSWYDALVFCNRLSIKEGLSPAYSIGGKTDPTAWGTVPTSSNATWNAVEIVAGSTGYRLPTEAQWEYACRAGTTTAYNTGDTISDDTGWYSSNSGDMTHEVGKKSVNTWGLHDMHGNVLEWCWDWYGDYPSEAQKNPMGASSGPGRVFRGGSWGNAAKILRSAIRRGAYPGYRLGSIGFRLVRP